MGDSIASALKQTVLCPRQDKQQCMRGCEGIFRKKTRKSTNASDEEAIRGDSKICAMIVLSMLERSYVDDVTDHKGRVNGLKVLLYRGVVL